MQYKITSHSEPCGSVQLQAMLHGTVFLDAKKGEHNIAHNFGYAMQAVNV